MIQTSQEFQAAIVGSPRRVEILAVVDLSDPDMVKGEVSTPPLAPWSRAEQLWDKKFDTPPRYATLEPGRWLLDGSFDLFPDDYQVPESMGMASQTVSGADGRFAQPVVVTMEFSGVRVLQTLTVRFSEDPADGVGEEFTAEVLSGGAVYYTGTAAGNHSAQVTFRDFTVYSPEKIRLTIKKWTLPERRVRILEVMTGLYETWDQGMLARFEAVQQGDFSCLSLPYGSLRLAMDNSSRRFEPRRKDSIFESIEEGQNIEAYLGVRLPKGGAERVRLGRFYMAGDGWRTSENSLSMEWYLVDIIGLVCGKTFLPPEQLPATLGGWLSAVVSHLGADFSDRWHADPAFANLPVTANSREDVEGQKCGDIIRWACQATGTWPRARPEDGRLAAEPLWSQGNRLTLDNLAGYPKMTANQTISALIFQLTDEAGEKFEYVVSGNSTSSETTVTIRNPFLHTREQALAAARLILSQYGGNVLETTGRGDPSSEIGDVDTVWLDESNAAAGRRMMQSFTFQNGVLQGCRSRLLQADGAYLFETSVVITESGTFTIPAGVALLRVTLIQGGSGGGHGAPGTDSTWNGSRADLAIEPAKFGEQGEPGQGGKVWVNTISVNPGGTVQVRIGAGGGPGKEGEETTFGLYSSAGGQRYPNGYTDILNGRTYARTGVPVPLSGTGDGGQGGAGGEPGTGYWVVPGDQKYGYGDIHFVEGDPPGNGYPGEPGGRGLVLVSWQKLKED